MPRLSPLFLLCVLAACDRTPGFDERYEKQSDRIGATANSIEKQVADQISGAAAAERAAAEVSARTEMPDNSPVAP